MAEKKTETKAAPKKVEPVRPSTKLYNWDIFYNGGNTNTKNVRLDELHNIYEKMKQDNCSFAEAAANLGDMTAEGLVTKILDSAGVNRGRMFNDFVKWAAQALDAHVEDTDKWQNPQFGHNA